MKKIISYLTLLLVLSACNVAAGFRGQRIYLQDKQEIYNEFDMSIFRDIFPDMSYKEMVQQVGEPNDFYDEDNDEHTHNPIYYGKEGKVEVSWSEDLSEDDEIGLVTYYPYYNVKFKLEDFVHHPLRMNISKNKKKFAVYVDDVLYFIVYLDKGNITKIKYWYIKEKYF